MPESLVVAFRPLRSCMVSLPSRWASALAAQPASRGCMVFKLSWGERLAYVAWSGGVSRASEHRPHRDRAGALSSGTLEIDGTFGSRLGLRDGDTVGVEYEPDVVTCTAAEVVPEHFDDWEILELNAGAVEGGLLAQVRAVAVGQPIVFWLNPSTAVTLSTASVTPKAQVCLLDNDTEVAVAPKVRRANLADSDDTAARSPDGNDGLSRICCLRVAAGEDIGFGTVYVSPESALASQVAKLTAGGAGDAVVRIGHAIAPRATRVSASSPEGDEDRWLSPWLARLGTSAAVQPGVLLASPSMLAAAGYAIGELVRAQGVAGGATTAVRPAVLSFSGMQLMVDSDDIRSALQCALEGTERRQLVLNVGSSIPGDDGRLLARLVSFQTPDSEEPTESAEVPLCLSEDVLADLEIRCIPKLPSLDADEGEQPAADL
ncbi:Peroxisome biosynthesis protein pex1, partial [Coemansia biformis]